MASDVIASPTGSEGDEGRGRTSGRVSEKDSQSDHTHKPGAADSSGVARMTPSAVSERVNELTHEMGRSFNGTTGAGRVHIGNLGLHFLFVKWIPIWAASLIDVEATGFMANRHGGALLVATMAATVAATTLPHRLVERPGIEIARWRMSSRKTPASLVVVPQAQCELLR